MIKFCPQCVHYRLRPTLRVVQSGSGGSAGRVNAATEELRLERERRDSEQRRIDEGYRFDYEPNFVPWCARYTPSRAELDEIKAVLMVATDVAQVIQTASEEGKDFLIDPANGVVRPVYALCRRQNANGDCPGYLPRSGG